MSSALRFHCYSSYDELPVIIRNAAIAIVAAPTMQAARQGFRAAFRSTSRTFPRLRTFRSSPFLSTPRRHASYRYQRFGESGGKGGQQQQWSNFGPTYRAQYIWRNYRTPILVVSGGGGTFYVYNLEQAPVTHRRRFNCIGPSTEAQFGAQGYEETLAQYRGKILPEIHPYTQAVAKVVERLLPATHGLSASEEWRVHVIDDPEQKNAFVLPGGKVFVFTGLLPITKDEAGLAAVLGHEIAHNVAHHLAERISQSIIVAGTAIVIASLFDISGQVSNNIANLALSLPNSRTQEQEADHIGLLMMAESCYDPEAAVDLWTRMAKAEQGAPPQFLSTHPTSYNRRELIKKWLPDARLKYEQSECGMTGRYASDFKQAFQGKVGQAQAQAQTGRRQPQPVYVQGRGQNDDEDDDFF